jgi:hypothetical protein
MSLIEYCIYAWSEVNKVSIQDVDIENSNLMERKEHYVKILIIIFMKCIEDSSSPNSSDLLPVFEKSIMIAVDEIISNNFDTSMSH